MKNVHSKKKLIFVHDIPLSGEYYRRYQFKKLMTDFQLIYIYIKHADVKVDVSILNEVSTENFRINRVLKYVNDGSLIVVTASDSIRMSIISVLAKFNSTKICKIYWGYYPTIQGPRNFIDKLLDFSSYPRYIKTFAGKLFLNLFRVKYDIGFYAGAVGGVRANAACVKTVEITHWDLSEDVMMSTSINNLSGDIIFLDENLPYHIDFEVMNWPKVDADSYFYEVNIFLDQFSKKFGCNVAIAAHPKANIELLKAKYNFPVYQGVTNTLIANSKYVIGHASTSLGIAVAMNKKIVIYCDSNQEDIYAHTRWRWMRALASELGVEITRDIDSIFIAHNVQDSGYTNSYLGKSKIEIASAIACAYNA